MKKILLSTLSILAILGAAQFAAAQTLQKAVPKKPAATAPAKPAAAASVKPMVSVAFSGYDKLKGDIDLIGTLGGNPNVAAGLEAMINMMTQGEGLKVIDTKKPWAAFLVPAPGSPQGLVFVPVTGMDALIGLLQKFGLEPKDQGDGVYTVEGPNATLTIKKVSAYAMIATGEDALKAAPADPIAALGGLEKKYDLAVRISVANVPDEYKQLAISGIRMKAQADARKMPGEDDEAYAVRVDVSKRMTQQIIDLINETDEALLGWAVDGKSKSARLTLAVKALPDTKLAKTCASLVDTKTEFAGAILPGATLAANWGWTLTDDAVARMKGALKQARMSALKDVDGQAMEDAKRDLAKRAIGDLFDVFEKTLDSKKAEGGMSVALEPESIRFVMAGAVADGAKLEATLKRLAPEIEKDVPDAKVKLNAETYKGVRVHTISAPLPKDEDAQKAAKFFGKTAELALGVSDKAVYVAAGRDAVKTLKTAIDGAKTPKTIPPITVTFAVGPLVKFIAATSEDNPQAQMTCQMITGLLEKAPGKDRVTINVKGLSSGAAASIELEEGILALIGGASQMAAGPGMAPGIKIEETEEQ